MTAQASLLSDCSEGGRIFFCQARANDALVRASAAHPDERAAYMRVAWQWKSLADQIRRGLN